MASLKINKGLSEIPTALVSLRIFKWVIKLHIEQRFTISKRKSSVVDLGDYLAALWDSLDIKAKLQATVVYKSLRFLQLGGGSTKDTFSLIPGYILLYRSSAFLTLIIFPPS